MVGPGVVPQHSDFNNLQCQTSLTALTGAKGIFLRCQTGEAFFAASLDLRASFGDLLQTIFAPRLCVDKSLRRLCGWEYVSEVPSEATFSRAFAEFAVSELPAHVHEALIKRTHAERLVGHISRDVTAIEAREKPMRVAAPATPKRQRGRPRKGEAVPKKEPRRLQRQGPMSLAEMLADLPSTARWGP